MRGVILKIFNLRPENYPMKPMITIPIFLLATLGCMLSMSAQTPGFEAAYDSVYQENISREYINNVYIPEDLDDAFREIKSLSSPSSLEKFSAEDESVTRKLHFGIGGWIMHNWNFYDGSRFSHHLKSYGIHNPDDMVQFFLIAFHRHLNEKPLALDTLAAGIIEQRQQILEEQQKDGEVIEVIRRKRPEPEKPD